jgi:deoxycytidylate deaminase
MKNKHVTTQIEETSYYSRYMSLIRYANEYRKLAKNPAALAGLAVAQIRRKRSEVSKAEDQPALGNAFIVRQFKRPEEIELMRRTYGRKFVQVSVYGSETDRKTVLINKIRHFDPSPKSDADCEGQALKLIEVDNNQIDDANGQRVSDVFHLGDVFVDGIDSQKANATIRRFIRALFGDNRISPNKDEYGLYTAAAASLRSVDLSRQVGAAIFTKQAEVLSLGCNEVPKAKGGTYWSDDKRPIFRDVDIGTDANQDRKNEIFYDLVERLSKEKFLSKKPATPKAIQSYVDRILDRQAIKDSQFMDILEFGRMIHAEMSAISDAARLGRPTKGATLFCTTFPCHICAKHIVAAGIDRVVFLEPYPKSYAKKLHDDSITFDPKEKSKVLFQAFIGISPRRYRDIFEKKKRKDENHVVKDWYEGKPVPRIEDRSSGYIDNEGPAVVYALGTLYSLKNNAPLKNKR